MQTVKTRFRQKIRTEQFAKKYVENDLNGTKTVKELYNPKNDGTARVMATEILANPNVQIAVREQLDEMGLTDTFLDGELYKVAKQSKVLPSKLNAIVEANKMKQRYPRESQSHLHLHGINADNIDTKIDEVLQEIRSLKQNDTLIEGSTS